MTLPIASDRAALPLTPDDDARRQARKLRRRSWGALAEAGLLCLLLLGISVAVYLLLGVMCCGR